MTRIDELRGAVREAVVGSSLRAVGKEIGISHTTVASFLDGPDEPSARTVEKVDRWYRGDGPASAVRELPRTPYADRRAARPTEAERAAAFDVLSVIIRRVEDGETDALERLAAWLQQLDEQRP